MKRVSTSFSTDDLDESFESTSFEDNPASIEAEIAFLDENSVFEENSKSLKDLLNQNSHDLNQAIKSASKNAQNIGKYRGTIIANEVIINAFYRKNWRILVQDSHK